MFSKLNQKLISVFLIVIILVAIIWIFQKTSIRINFKALIFNGEKCRENAIRYLLNPETNLKSLVNYHSGSGWIYPRSFFNVAEPHISIITYLQNRNKEEVEKEFIEEYETDGTKKIKDILEFPLNLDAVDVYAFDKIPGSKPFFMGEFCKSPKFIEVKLKP